MVFSGLVYFLFMAAWLNLFYLLGHLRLITLLAGAIAVLVAGLAVSFAQHAPTVALDRIAPKMSKISPAAGLKRLFGWEGAVTTIVESPGDRVFVALYDVHPRDAAQLDEVEGVVSGTYRRLHVRVVTLDGEVTAWVYVFAGYEGGLPTAWYLSEIANAAEKAGAPDDYVAELRARPTGTAST